MNRKIRIIEAIAHGSKLSNPEDLVCVSIFWCLCMFHRVTKLTLNFNHHSVISTIFFLTTGTARSLINTFSSADKCNYHFCGRVSLVNMDIVEAWEWIDNFVTLYNGCNYLSMLVPRTKYKFACCYHFGEVCRMEPMVHKNIISVDRAKGHSTDKFVLKNR